MRTLVAIPVYNEARHVERVVRRVAERARDILVIDDGSTDATPTLLSRLPVEVIRHSVNRGYGRAILDAFRWAMVDGYDWAITMDCDEQHEPASIPDFMDAARAGDADIVSGSRYLAPSPEDDAPPADRRRINTILTQEINSRLGLRLTDAFCGFKAHRVKAIKKMTLDEPGYAFPMQFWAQARAHGLRIREIPVRLIYHDPTRTFGGPLNEPEARLAHYRAVLEREVARARVGTGAPVQADRLAAACDWPEECRTC